MGWRNSTGWSGQAGGWEKIAAAAGGGGGAPTVQTVTWTNLQAATDNGGGTIANAASPYYARGQTTQTFAVDGGYFEFTVGGTGMSLVGISTGAYPVGNGTGTADTTLAIGFNAPAASTGSSVYKNGAYTADINVVLPAGSLIRMTRSGTSLLINVNGALHSTVTGMSWGTTPWYGVWKAQNDVTTPGTYSITSAKIYG